MFTEESVEFSPIRDISPCPVAASGGGERVEAAPEEEGCPEFSIRRDLVFHIHIRQEEEALRAGYHSGVR